jgi:uncharacterized coiled-coil DUF342 family protein
MDNGNPEKSRERITRWVQEGASVIALIPPLINSDDQVRVRTEALERECEALRKEAAELRRENQQLRGERDEIAQAFSKLMESAQPMNQIAQKLGLRKSPFERDPRQVTS